MAVETAREKALSDYKKKLLEHRELDARLKESKSTFSSTILSTKIGLRFEIFQFKKHLENLHWSHCLNSDNAGSQIFFY